PYLALSGRQRLSSKRRRTIDLAQRPTLSLHRRTQVSLFFQPMQQGIEAAWTDPVTMTRQLVDHTEAENRLVHSVVQDMQPQQSRVKIPVIVLELRFRHSITKLVYRETTLSSIARRWQV